MGTMDLFTGDADAAPHTEPLADGASVLRGFARTEAVALVAAVEHAIAGAPLRHLVTPGGFEMSVAMSNCGPLGWVSDRSGYRYSRTDPLSGRPWPTMPDVFTGLARRAAEAAGFAGFAPDACLINQYLPGARLSLHQDRDERDHRHPIVSVSLGLSAVFQFGGLTRSERPRRVPLEHGDVVVWGGASRLRFHGVLALADGEHALLGARRINLTFRKAG